MIMKIIYLKYLLVKLTLKILCFLIIIFFKLDYNMDHLIIKNPKLNIYIFLMR